jgi:putative sterol carrier protein
MADPTTEFFDELSQRGHEELLRKASGSVCFEIGDGSKVGRWLLQIEKGQLAVSRKNAKADCVVRADRALFDKVATGELNAVAAVMRGELAVDGDWRLLVLVQRLFPGQHARQRRRAAGYARRQP